MLPDSIPLPDDADNFLDDPLQLLTQARARHGNLFALRKEGPIFSRAPECGGVVAAFGMDNQRAVLSDIESFALPVSAAENMKLPANLVNLNRSLHSMRGAEHSAQKRLLIGLLSNVEPVHRAVWGALEETMKGPLEPVALVGRMRDLMLHTSLRVLFDGGYAGTWQLASMLQIYFHLRREATAPGNTVNQESVEELVSTGNLLDSTLRSFIRRCREIHAATSGGVLAKLAAEIRLSEDEIVGHMNVFFISTTEPVAIALSWILLVLSQLPELRKELRSELEAALQDDAYPTTDQINKLVTLDSVINETLRLLPPNALMVRITTKPTHLNSVALPAGCEVVLSPFISHRDRAAFDQADKFLSSRWGRTMPSPFLYFPFGAGGHSCIGRGIAMDMIKTTLAFLLPRYDVLLAESQDIDWSIRIQFMPTPDPTVIFYPRQSDVLRSSGIINGPVAELLKLERVSQAS